MDDVGFVLALLDDLAKRMSVDGRRVYATGLSNGAMMAYRLAAEESDRIAAIAPVAGGMVVDSFAPTRSVAIMDFHSVDDPRALHGGGLGPAFPLTTRRVMHPPVAQVLAKWIARDRCPEQPVVAPSAAGRPGTADSGQRATKLVYGHAWPGGEQGGLEGMFVGRPTHVIDANVEIWRFFSRFTR